MPAASEPDVNPIPADVRALLAAAEPAIIADAGPPPTVPLTYPELVTALTRVAVYELVDGAYRLLEGDHP